MQVIQQIKNIIKTKSANVKTKVICSTISQIKPTVVAKTTKAKQNLNKRLSRFGFTNYIKNNRRITTAGLTSSCLLVLLILAICIPLYKDELNTKATTGTSTQATTSLALSSGASSTA
ncbi:hypothetical protein IJG04_02645, partial [Candidatus Saccharibacteria bacterium]|nr:hypothetical protein [Candidatus Saccharibacteria bacterium]